MDLDACLFDAYGTLFNVHAAAQRLRDRLGDRADRLSDLWRVRQLEYTWLRANMGVYAPFSQVTREALDYAMEAVGIDDQALKADLIATYAQVETYPDVRPTLEGLRAKGLKTAVFSNADPAMLGNAVAVAGLDDVLDEVISVDGAGTFKPRPEVYAHALARCGADAARAGFVSSNGWDAAGATSAGLHTFWCNRGGAPLERIPSEPRHVVGTLTEVVDLIGGSAETRGAR